MKREICCLCKGKIELKGSWTQGNNAQPLMEGRCCDKCNITKVIPIRIEGFQEAPLAFPELKEVK